MKILIFFTFLLSTPSLFSKALPTEIYVCGDGSEWPPYTYYLRNTEAIKTDKIVGYTVDLLTKALAKHKIKVNFELPPWKRCLSQVEENDHFTIALDSSYSEERNKKFLLTKSYYSVTPKLFYLKKKYPKGFPEFKNAKELLAVGNICGLQGYNYEGFIKGINNSEIDTGTRDFDALVSKTRNNACVAFLARSEILKGFRQIGKDFLIDKEIMSLKLPNVKKEKFYMMISRKFNQAQKLKELIDNELPSLINNKQLKRKHLK